MLSACMADEQAGLQCMLPRFAGIQQWMVLTKEGVIEMPVGAMTTPPGFTFSNCTAVHMVALANGNDNEMCAWMSTQQWPLHHAHRGQYKDALHAPNRGVVSGQVRRRALCISSTAQSFVLPPGALSLCHPAQQGSLWQRMRGT